jgi:hypothetical protein
MKIGFNKLIRTALITAILKNTSERTHIHWKPLIDVYYGQTVISDNKLYVALKDGKTGINRPAHISGTENDGNIDFVFVKELPDYETFGHFYGAISKTGNEDSDVVFSVEENERFFENLIVAKKITSHDIRLGIKKNIWAGGLVYKEYTDTESEYRDNCFVVTNKRRLYKCLLNNGGGQSMAEPDSLATIPFYTGDGYLWQYIAEIPIDDYYNFLSEYIMPLDIKNVVHEFKSVGVSHFKILKMFGSFYGIGSENIVYTLIDNVTEPSDSVKPLITHNKNNEVLEITLSSSGVNYKKPPWLLIYRKNDSFENMASLEVGINQDYNFIDSIKVTNSGKGYGINNSRLIIIGDGSGAEGTLRIESGRIVSASIDKSGTGYTWAKAFALPDSICAVAKGYLQPRVNTGTPVIDAEAPYLIIMFKMNNNEAYFEIGEDGYDSFALISGVFDNMLQPAFQIKYIGPKHPLISDDTQNLNVLNKDNGIVLYRSNFKTLHKKDNQDELFQVIIKL